ncbi:hypothetical protein [Enterococcus faecalis]|uniref:hypothetical protein n=1 Tax=Enterococcus faecalis TaxID=1351 RepID=UPI001D194521|nr:hypothetical protein [Enterococcus faecalis]MCC4085850.1 hypothetical protein [Enterococcus faecalis]
MTENNSRFDFSDFYEEGFEKTENLEQAIYVFQDGTLWSGYSEGGDGFSRDVDHGAIEAFFKDSSIDRYHPDFHSLKLKEMIQIVPETRTVLTLIDNHYSQEQIEVLQQLEENDFIIEQLESTLQVEAERLNLEEYQEDGFEEENSESYLYDIDIVEENEKIVQAYNRFLKNIEVDSLSKNNNQYKTKDKINENEQFNGISHDI